MVPKNEQTDVKSLMDIVCKKYTKMKRFINQISREQCRIILFLILIRNNNRNHIHNKNCKIH